MSSINGSITNLASSLIIDNSPATSRLYINNNRLIAFTKYQKVRGSEHLAVFDQAIVGFVFTSLYDHFEHRVKFELNQTKKRWWTRTRLNPTLTPNGGRLCADFQENPSDKYVCIRCSSSFEYEITDVSIRENYTSIISDQFQSGDFHLQLQVDTLPDAINNWNTGHPYR